MSENAGPHRIVMALTALVMWPRSPPEAAFGRSRCSPTGLTRRGSVAVLGGGGGRLRLRAPPRGGGPFIQLRHAGKVGDLVASAIASCSV